MTTRLAWRSYANSVVKTSTESNLYRLTELSISAEIRGGGCTDTESEDGCSIWTGEALPWTPASWTASDNYEIRRDRPDKFFAEFTNG